jgi:polyphosphate kinase
MNNPAKNPTRRTLRPAKEGDVAPDQSESGLEKFSVKENIDAAQFSKLSAVEDILSQLPHTQDAQSLRDSLATILQGASPDDAAKLQHALFGGSAMSTYKQQTADEALHPDWRKGAYPYKNLLSRKSYEKQKYALQVELLKL